MRFFEKAWPWMIAVAVYTSTAQSQSTPPAKAVPSAAEMLNRLRLAGEQVEADNRHVLHLQAKARRNKDIIKLTCINDKLVELRAQNNLFDDGKIRVEGAEGNADTAEAFGAAMDAADEVKHLRAEADICAGEAELYKQESRTDVERPDIVDDPNDDTDNFDPGFEPPAYASPFM